MRVVTYRKLALLLLSFLVITGLPLNGRAAGNLSLGASTPAAPQDHTLHGRITDATTGLGILGQLTALTGPNLFNISTDANGNYSISTLDGSYYIRIQSGHCHIPSFQNVTITADTQLDVALAPILDTDPSVPGGSYGYSCDDLSAFSWSAGTSGASFVGNDQLNIPVPFSFNYYNQAISTVWATRDGYLTMGQQYVPIVDQPSQIPSVSPPNRALYPYWTRFTTNGGHGSVYTATVGTAPNRKFVIEWRDMALYLDPNPSNPTTLNFEVILYEGNGQPGTQWDFQYLHTGLPNVGQGANATIGMENPNGNGALQYAYNDRTLQDNTRIRFFLPPVGTVTGVVTDQYTGQPLHAQVCVHEHYQCSYTDTNNPGHYSKRLAAGVWTLDATAPKHITGTHQVNITAGGTTTQNFALGSAHVLYNPSPVNATLPTNTIATQTLLLNNQGIGTLQYRLREALGPQPSGCGTLAPGEGLQGVTTVEQVWPAPDQPIGGAKTVPPRAPTRLHYTAPPGAAGPFAPPAHILVYADDPYHTPSYPELALQALGWTYTVVIDNAANFDDQLLHHGPWDMLVITDEYDTNFSNYFEDVRAYMDAGGRAVFMTFDYEDSLGPATTLFESLGIHQPVDISADLPNPQAITPWEPSEFIFRCPVVLTPTLTMNAPSPPPGDYGDRLTANSRGLEWGGLSVDPIDGNAVIIGRDDGRSVSTGFTLSTLTDVNQTTHRAYGVDLLVNMIKYVGNPPIPWGNIPWLTEAPTDGSVPPTTPLSDTLTFNTTGLAPGTYTGYLFGFSNDPNAYRTQVQVNLTVCNPCQTGDLAVVGIHPQAGHPGPGLNTVQVDVKNMGDQPILASNYLYVDLFVDLHHPPGTSDPSQGFATIPQTIPPGQQVTVSISWNATTPTMHDFYAWVNRDCLPQVGENGCSTTSPGNNLFGPVYGCTYTTSNGSTFTDVTTTHTFYPYVEYMACLGSISGYSTSPPCTTGTPCFFAGNPATRGQFTKILANSVGWADVIPSTRQTFRDVPNTNPFWVYIERAVAHGAISGYSASPPCAAGQAPCFLPGNNITRGQIAKVVVSAKGWGGYAPATPTFQDVPTTSPFFVFVEQAYRKGIISGYTAHPPCPGGTPCFLPGNNATRGQLSKITMLAVQQP